MAENPVYSPASQAIGLAVALGLVVHQIWRKYETYSIPTHMTLLFGPPVIVTAFAAPPQWSLLRATLLVTAAYLVSLVSSVVLYRISPLHPLSRYPGPIWCKVSKLYLGFVCVPGFQHKYIKALHDRYGDVVRIGPNELSIRNADLVAPLLGANGVPKGPHFIGRLLSADNLPLVGIQDLDEHMDRRRNWNRGMGPVAMKEYLSILVRRGRQLISRLEEQKGDVVIGTWFGYFAYDFMSDMAFGGGSELLENGTDEGNVWKVLDDGMFIATFFGHMPWLGVYIAKIPAATGNLMILLKYCAECTAARVKKGSEKKDLFHYLNQEDRPELPPPPVQQLIDDGVLAIVAGADTTAIALTNLLFCLLTHPEAYEKLQAEVDTYYPAGSDAFDIKYHRDMPYLTAVINETLRVYPPVPGGSQRQVPPDSKGVTVGDIYLPPGTIFWQHIYANHHDARNFAPYTSDFWPERWLIASGELSPSDPATRTVDMASFVHNEAGFLPFSTGPMNCVGKSLAMQEMRLVVCSVLQRFRIKLRDGWDKVRFEQEYRDYFTASKAEYSVSLEVR